MKIPGFMTPVIITLASVLFFLAIMARIESHKELIFIRVMDVVIGLLFAVSFVLDYDAKLNYRRKTVIVAIVIWLLVSVLLVSWHEFQVSARTSAAEHGITRGRIMQAYQALKEYSKDHGSFPSEAQGLDALCKNPGLPQRPEPYLPDQESIIDYWGHRLRYTLHSNRPVVWSCGKDGISGTEDDITVDEDDR